ncbi:MAG: ZIP family metal transporter [bacterium]|nr:ZIP family metal transporter [bacterium]MDZ4231310.1 ZIP family metal transporter [Patescibacteria group bacterium]
MLYQIIVASVIGGVLSLIGGLILLWREAFARKVAFYLVSFAAGALLGAAFFDLIPEALEGGGEEVVGFILVGIILVFVFERFLGWYHYHNGHPHEHHTFTVQSVLLGDTLHNFIDGAAIALSFAVSTEVGITTTLAVFVHEIPQEIGDFGVLIKKGYQRGRIVLFNLLTALATLVGAILTYFLFPYFPEGIVYYGLALTAGTFIYISTADLIPELREHTSGGFGMGHAAMILLGIVTVVLLSGIIVK